MNARKIKTATVGPERKTVITLEINYVTSGSVILCTEINFSFNLEEKFTNLTIRQS